MAQLVAIKYKIQFNYDNDPKDFTFVDIVAAAYNTTYGLTLADIKGIIKVVSPSGVTVYINAGYAADDFSSPDIDGNTTDWEQDLGSLPLDDDDEVELGDYFIYYKLSTDGGTTVYNQADNEKSYDLKQYVSPVVDIDITQSCRTSELTSTDNTDYSVQVDNDTIDPTITRAHKIVKPEGAGCTIPATASTNEQIRILGGGGTAETDIWTGVWQTTITSTLVYDLATWDGEVWIQINDEVTGYDHSEVLCNDCLCDIRQCLDTLYYKWQNAIGVESKNRVEELKIKNIMATANFMLYEVNERCGECSSTYCDNLANILTSEDCTCATSTDDASQRVIAWGNSTGTGSTPLSPSAWLNGIADPSAGLGANGDYYLQTGTGISGVEGNVYYKSGGAWSLLINIVGADGAAGTDTNYEVLENDISDSALGATVARTELKDYTIVGGTLAENGSYLKVTAILVFELNNDIRTVAMDFGGDTIISYDIASTVELLTKYITLEATIERISATTQLVRAWATRSGRNNPRAFETIIEDDEILSGNLDIEIYGQSDTSNDETIICKQLKVEHFINQ